MGLFATGLKYRLQLALFVCNFLKEFYMQEICVKLRQKFHY
jgi:hypothetical protein